MNTPTKSKTSPWQSLIDEEFTEIVKQKISKKNHFHAFKYYGFLNTITFQHQSTTVLIPNHKKIIKTNFINIYKCDGAPANFC